MLTCPFCNADYSTVGLRDGRCRSCGGVIAWDDGEPVDAAVLQKVEAAAFAQLTRSSISSTPDEGVDLYATVFEQAPAAPQTTVADAQAETPTAPDMAYVTSVWQQASRTASTPLKTIQSRDAYSTPDAPLLIRPRSLKHQGELATDTADYELLDVIGEGGVGVVYAARQASIDREVALKMLRTDAASEQQTNSFLSEAVVTGDLDHPNIVAIHDLGRSDSGALFYAMKRVQGTPWNEVLASKSLAENVEILMKVADAVAFAHDRGIVHRDLKPENVMLGGFGEVLLMDWGIAVATKHFAKAGRCNTADSMGGTPAYMAPEMVTGPFADIGPAADIYLLGAILYEIVAGHPPHTGKDVMACLMAAARNEIRPSDRRHELLDIALKAMASSPHNRQASVLHFQQEIRTYQSHSESILLSTRAAEDARRGRDAGGYELYARSVFAFEEALALWEGNAAARSGLSATRLEYAERALKQEDFDLGLSLLDADVPEFASLRNNLQTGQRERNARQARLKSVKRLVALLVVALFAGGTFALIKINDARETAETSRLEALQAKGETEDALDRANEAITKEQAAVKEQQLANEQAMLAKQAAETERDRADVEKRRAEQLFEIAEEESYFAEIGLASERVATNAFTDARAILRRQSESLRARMRHWEWGRLEYLCFGEVSHGEATRRTRESVGFPIEAMALAPDAKSVLVASANGNVQLRGRDDGQILRQWNHGGPLTSVAFSADGRFAITAGSNNANGVAKLWDLQAAPSDTPLRSFGPQGTVILGLAVAPSAAGTRLVTCSDNKIFKLWNYTTGEMLQTFAGHLARVWSASFSPDGSRIVSASEDGSARVWSTTSGAELQRFSEHDGPVFAVAYSPDGKLIASAGYDSRVLLWEEDADQARGTDLLDRVASAVRGETIPPPEFRTFAGHAASVAGVMFSPAGDFLVSFGHDNTIRVWDTADNLVSQEDRPSDVPNTVAELLRRRQRQSDAAAGLLATLRGHGGWIKGCSFVGDGRTIISASLDEELRTWDLLSHEELRVFQGTQRPMLAAAMSPDMRFIVTGLDDGTAHVWDVNSGHEMTTLEEGHEYLTSTATFFPDGQRLLTAGGDDTTRIWSVRRGIEEQVLHGTGRRGFAALSLDGSMVLTGASGKRAKLWDVASGREIQVFDPNETNYARRQKSHPHMSPEELRKPFPEISALALSPDNRWALTGDSAGRCYLWDVESGTIHATLRGHSQSISAAYFISPPHEASSATAHLITASTDGIVHQWNLTTNEYRRDLAIKHRYPVMSMAISSDAKYCLTASAASPGEGGLWLWELATARLVKQHVIPNRTVQTVTFDAGPDGMELAALVTTTDEQGRRALLRWDIETDNLSTYWNHQAQRGSLWTAQYTPDHTQLLTVGGKGARLWNETTGQQTSSFRPQAAITAVCISPASDEIVTGSRDATVKTWSLETGKATNNLTGAHSAEITSLQFSPDGTLLLSTDRAGLAVLWDAATGKRLTEDSFSHTGGTIHAGAFSPDDVHLLTAGSDANERGVVTVWSRDGKSVLAFDAHPRPVLCAAYSADGQWIMTGSEDGSACIWSADKGRQVAALEGHSAAVRAVSFSQDRLRVLTSSDDSSAKVWDTTFLATGQASAEHIIAPKEITTLKHHAQSVTTVAFSTDGQHILTSSLDGTAALWLGLPMNPAVRLSNLAVDYRSTTGPQILDDHIIFSSPTRVDLNQSTLTVSAGETGDPADRFTLVANAEGHCAIAPRDNEVLYRCNNHESLVAQFAGGSNAAPLIVTFTAAADRMAVELVMRSVAFEHQAAATSDTNRTIQFDFRLRDGQRGNFETESKTIHLQSQ